MVKKLEPTLTVRSRPAVANQYFTSGCQSQANTGPLWAVNCLTYRSFLRKSHICTVPFSDTAANEKY